MPAHRLSILHISDLHARSSNVDELKPDKREDRRRRVQREAVARRRVLGDAWDKNLRALYQDGVRPDLVCFTGDVSDWGLCSEYATATEFVRRTVEVLGVSRSQIYVVPGNHDVNRDTSDTEWRELRDLMWSDTGATSDWLAGGRPPRKVDPSLADFVLRRTAAFWRWVAEDLGRPELLPSRSAHRRLGYRHELRLPHLPFVVHVIGLDSAWLAGDDHDQGQLWLTQHQRDMLVHDSEGLPLVGFRLALVHHPFDDLAQPELGPSRRMGEALDLLLHGHQHEPVGSTLVDLDGRSLRVLAAGCLYEGTVGAEWKNGCQRIDIELDASGRPTAAEIRFRSWSARADWHADSSLYRNQTADGRMHWRAWDEGTRPVDRSGPRRRVDNIRLTGLGVFEGRAGELERIGDELARSGVAVLTGLGGVGKSRLALEHALGAGEQYDVRWWVRANEIATMQTDLVALGEQLGILSQAEDVEKATREVLNWLGTNRRWLLVFDNATGPEVTRARLPSSGMGHVIITSTAQAWSVVALPIEVRGIAPEAASLMLLRGSGRADDGSVDAIARELGYLPLALVQAAAYIDAVSCSFREYVQRLEQYGAAVLRSPSAAPRDDYKQTVDATWGISLAEIVTRSSDAAALLNWLAFLDADGVPLRLLRDHTRGLPADIAACVASDLALDEAVAVLRRFSMVDRVETPEVALRVHRLVQLVTLDRLDDGQRRHLAASAVEWTTAAFAYVPDETAIGSVSAGVAAQVMAVGMLQACAAEKGHEVVWALVGLGTYRARRGMLDAARVASERALHVAEALAKADPHSAQARRDLSVSLDKLGGVEVQAGNLAVARGHFERSLELREALAKADPHSAQAQRDLSVSLDKLGDVEVQAGNLAVARGHFERSLELTEALAKADPHSAQAHRDLSVSLNKLGDVEVQAENLAVARGHCERSLELREALAKADPHSAQAQRDLSLSLDKLGDVEVQAGNLAVARGHFERSLELREAQAKADPLSAEPQRDLPCSLTKLGNVELQAGNPAVARRHLERSLTLNEALAKAEPLSAQARRNVVVSLLGLAALAEEEGDLDAFRTAVNQVWQRLTAMAAIGQVAGDKMLESIRQQVREVIVEVTEPP